MTDSLHSQCCPLTINLISKSKFINGMHKKHCQMCVSNFQNSSCKNWKELQTAIGFYGDYFSQNSKVSLYAFFCCSMSLVDYLATDSTIKN